MNYEKMEFIILLFPVFQTLFSTAVSQICYIRYIMVEAAKREICVQKNQG
jgi:hypothetical protein